MEKQHGKSRLAAVLSTTLLGFLIAAPASAAVLVGGKQGWEVSFDGNINTFYIYESSQSLPQARSSLGSTTGDLSSGVNSSTIRTGLLPTKFGFNVMTPEVNGLKGGIHFGLFPQIQNAQTKNQFGAQIDLRQAYATIDGSFGQVLIGRQLSLFLGENILTDMTLYGVGVQGAVNSGGTTLGRIGYGYVYPNFNAQIRYTTPDINGFKLSVGAFEPSRIRSNTNVDTSVSIGDVSNGTGDTPVPRFEAEGSFVQTNALGKWNTWVNGLWQYAKFKGGSLPNGDNTVNVWGVGAGLQWEQGPFGAVLSAYDGDGLGTTLLLDQDSLGVNGNTRHSYGGLAQVSYTFAGRTKIGLSWGTSRITETSGDRDARLAGGLAIKDRQDSATLGVYHDVNDWLKLVAEYTHARNKWANDSDQKTDLGTVGAFISF